MLPILILLAVALCGALSAMTTQIRCVDAARAGARAAARGESNAEIRTAIAQAAPNSARSTIGRSDGAVYVDVAAPISGIALLGSFTVHAEAEAADESAYDDTTNMDQATATRH